MSSPGKSRTTWRTRGLVTVLALVIVLACAVPAMAITIDTEAEVFEESCTPCHASIADSKSSEIIFKHAFHLLISCSSCHTKFPHRPEGTAKPDMKKCFECHGLQHGPQGLLAEGECEACHRTPKERLRPSFHVWDWKEKPHVEPSKAEMQTKCMMCHTGKFCDDCHAKEYVDWKPDKPYKFDTQSGCLACHANPALQKTSSTGLKSFQVTGVDRSAHADLTCQQCHADFKYEQGANRTNLWTVNAAYACAECHEHKEAAAEYYGSVHGKELRKGNMKSATCSSCHQGHNIQRLDTDAAKLEIHNAAERVCARCHMEQWESYDDYYHGAAYKKGVIDAPSCWDCHGYHNVLPSSDPSSTVAPANVAATCGLEGCHAGSTESFAEVAQSLIHQKVDAASNNPLARIVAKIKSWLS